MRLTRGSGVMHANVDNPAASLAAESLAPAGPPPHQPVGAWWIDAAVGGMSYPRRHACVRRHR